MTFQSASGYLLLEAGPTYTVIRAPILGEVLVERESTADWRARPPDAPRWELEIRQDVDALKGYRQAVLVLGRYTLTYWPWEVVRKWRLPKWRTVPRGRAGTAEHEAEPPTSGLAME